MLQSWPGWGQANCQVKLSSSNTDQYERNDISTDSLTYNHSHAAFDSGVITAIPFIVRTDSIRTLQFNIAP